MRKIDIIISKDNKTLKQLFQYFGVGGVAAIIEWTIFYALFLLDINYAICVTVAFIIATGVNYCLSRYVFEIAKFNIKKEMVLVYFISLVGLILNLLLMWFFYKKLKIFTLLAKIMATGIVFFWNFIGRKYWAFKN